MNINIKINSPELMTNLGYILTKYLYPNDVIAMTGDLGAGKTTFTKGIGKALEIKRVINSPTFTIMKIYDAVNKINGIEKLYHLDVYRLNDSTSDFELEEYFFQNGISIVEWADIIDDLLPDGHMHVTISDLGNNTRNFKIETTKDLSKFINDCKEQGYEVTY